MITFTKHCQHSAQIALISISLMGWLPSFLGARGLHDKLYVVPVSDDVVIDGRLDEWDLSAQLETFVVEETKDRMSASYVAMYDDEALYLAGVVKDDSPMMNRHDPWTNGDKGWDADSIQFRIIVYPSRPYPDSETSLARTRNSEDKRDDIVHFILWHYTDREEANLQGHMGMSYRVLRPEWGPHGVIPHDYFDGQYRKLESGDGYVFEYRIPWSTMGADAPLIAGDRAAGTIQFNWGRADGLKYAGGESVSYDLMRIGGFPFQKTETWGQLIFSPTGELPKSLVHGREIPEMRKQLEYNFELPRTAEASLQFINEDGVIVRNLFSHQLMDAGEHT